MRVEGDASAFEAAVDDVRARLSKLNDDGSLDGLVARFDRLVRDLPPDFIECEAVPAVAAVDPSFSALWRVVVRPGPRLTAFAAALWAFDLSGRRTWDWRNHSKIFRPKTRPAISENKFYGQA